MSNIPVVPGRFREAGQYRYFNSLGTARGAAIAFATRHPEFDDVVVVQLPSRAYTVARRSAIVEAR